MPPKKPAKQKSSQPDTQQHAAGKHQEGLNDAPSMAVVSDEQQAADKAEDQTSQVSTVEAVLPEGSPIPSQAADTATLTLNKDIRYEQYLIIYLILVAFNKYHSISSNSDLHQKKVREINQFLTDLAALPSLAFSEFCEKLRGLKDKLELAVSRLTAGQQAGAGNFALFLSQIDEAMRLVRESSVTQKIFGLAGKTINEIEQNPLFVYVDRLYRGYVLSHQVRDGLESKSALAADRALGDDGAKFKAKEQVIYEEIMRFVKRQDSSDDALGNIRASLAFISQKNETIEKQLSSTPQAMLHVAEAATGMAKIAVYSLAELAVRFSGHLSSYVAPRPKASAEAVEDNFVEIEQYDIVSAATAAAPSFAYETFATTPLTLESAIQCLEYELQLKNATVLQQSARARMTASM